MKIECETAVETAQQVAENQISFDFLNENLNGEEKSETQTLTSAKSDEWVRNETLVILVRARGGLSPDFDICGKKMIGWVELGTSFCKHKVIDEPSEEEFLDVVKREGKGFEYVAVLYSDTPMLERTTFLEIMDHFSKNRMNVMKLKRGYVFRREFLENAKMILSSQVEAFGHEDFVIVENAETVSFAFKILQRRILAYHKQHGVTFFGDNTIFVDADVEIDEGAVIYPNNVLKGQTVIGHCAILESGNYVLDSVVCDDAFVVQSYLESSKVGAGVTVGPFEKLIGKEV